MQTIQCEKIRHLKEIMRKDQSESTIIGYINNLGTQSLFPLHEIARLEIAFRSGDLNTLCDTLIAKYRADIPARTFTKTTL